MTYKTDHYVIEHANRTFHIYVEGPIWPSDRYNATLTEEQRVNGSPVHMVVIKKWGMFFGTPENAASSAMWTLVKHVEGVNDVDDDPEPE